ncbi:MAG TPA: PadR family transcriptional regulator [Rhodoglobus sp.]|nr:PadR family transcriptional regulator [Rhodoglobus sp.]
MSIARLSPLGIMALALLREGPMHPYEMMRTLRTRHLDSITTIKTGTFYRTIEQLERAELIEQLGTEREGNWPERTTYSLTDNGGRTLTEWVRSELPRIDHPAEFRVALAHANVLDAAEVPELLRTRRAALAQLLATLTAAHDASDAHDTGAAFVEAERAHALLVADLAWLDRALTAQEHGW